MRPRATRIATRAVTGLALLGLTLGGAHPVARQRQRRIIRAGDFILTYDERGVTGLASTRDPHRADLVAPGSRLGVMLKYRVEGGDWLDLYQAETVMEVTLPPDQASLLAEAEAGPYTVTYVDDVAGTVLDRSLDRVTFTVENRTGDAHRTALRMALPDAGYEVRVDGRSPSRFAGGK